MNETYQIRIDCKKKLYKAYGRMSEEEVKMTINEIIAENRKIPIEKARNQKKLRTVEIKIFKARIDPVYSGE